MSTVTFEALSARIAILEGIVKEKLAEKKQETSRVKSSLKKDGTERKKRAVSAYQLFCNENRLDVQAELNANIAEGEKLARGAVLYELATRWKQLDEDEKKAWIRDQYIHPIESLHTIDEVLKWFNKNNI